MQTFASMSKVPLLFFLTLSVTFPSLYVFNALVGSQLRIVPVLKLLMASLVVNLSVLASMGPILAFFSLGTPNYSFIALLNVAVFTVAGVLGLTVLMQTLNRLTFSQTTQPMPVATESPSTEINRLPPIALAPASGIACRAWRWANTSKKCSAAGYSCFVLMEPKWVGCCVPSSAVRTRPSRSFAKTRSRTLISASLN